MTYQRIILSGPTIDGEPGLPAELQGLADVSLANLGVASVPPPQAYIGIGYWPVIGPEPAPAGKVIASTLLEPDAATKTVKTVATYADAPTTYRPIDKVEAIALIRAVTGMTDAQELAFRDDTRLALFWRKWREDVGGTIHHDNPLTAAILDALQGTGYLDAGQRAAVLAYWPQA